MNKPLLENLELSSVKRNETGLYIEFIHSWADGEHPYEDILKKESDVPIGENLNNLLNSMRHCMFDILRMDNFILMAESKEFAAGDTQRNKIEKVKNDILMNIVINGISIKGDQENKSCVIKAKFCVGKTNQVIAINSPKIWLKNDAFGFEQEILETIEKLKVECYEYYYEPKNIQQPLFKASDAD